MSRLWALLAIAVALIVPTAVASIAPSDVRIEAAASTAQFAAPSNAKRTAVPCRGCTWKACSVSAIGCSAYCAAGNALIPGMDILVMITRAVTGSSVIAILRSHHGPPDPYPPRPIVIS